MRNEPNQMATAFEYPHATQNGKTVVLIGWHCWAMTNAYIAWNQMHTEHVTHKQFVLQVAQAYLTSEAGRQ